MHRKDRSWRAHFRPLITQALESGREAGLEGRKLWRYVCRSYPWGRSMGYWPRRIWVHEAAIQVGLKPAIKPRRRRPDAGGQGRFFEEQ